MADVPPSSSLNPGRRRGAVRVAFYRFAPLVVLVLGLALTLLVFREAKRVDEARVANTFDLRIEWRARDFQDKIADAAVPIEALADFASAEIDMAPEEFQQFALVGRGDDPISRLAWAPLVAQADRKSFVTDARNRGEPDFDILETNATGKLAPAAPAEFYAPIRYERRFEQGNRLVGLNVLADPVRRPYLDRARDTGEPTAVGPVARDIDGKEVWRYYVDFPVYRDVPSATLEGRRAALRGFALGTFRLDELVRFALRDTPPLIGRLSLLMGQSQIGPNSIPDASVQMGTDAIAIRAAPLGQPADGATRVSRTFRQFGVDWALVLDGSPAVAAGYRSTSPAISLALGLVLSLLLSGYVWREQRRLRIVEEAVRDRTHELSRVTDQMKAWFDAAPIAVGVVDLERRVLSWNPAAEQMFGYTAGEAIGNFYPALPPESEDASQETLRRMATGEILRGFEIVQRAKDGRMLDTLASASLFYDAAGSPVGIVFAVLDITERKRAEAALRQTQSLLTGIVDSSQDAIVSKKLDGTVTTWNRAAEILFGYAASEMIGHSISVLAPPGREDDMKNVLRKVASGETVSRYRTQRCRKDGAIIDISLTVSPIYDGQGDIIGASKIARDISDVLLAEAAQERQAKQMRALVEQAPLVIAMFDRDLRYIATSGMWTAEFGGGRSDLTGQQHYEVMPDIPDVWRENNRRALAGETVRNEEDHFLLDDGKDRWVRSVIQPWVDADGKVGGIIIAVDDFTKRKLAENSLRESEERYGAVFRDSPIGIVITDMANEGRIIEVNPAWLHILGFTREEVVGRNSIELNLWADPQGRDELYDFISTPRVVWASESRIRRKDGVIIDYAMTMRQIEIAGRPCGIALGYDVTDRKRLEQELRHSQEHLARVQAIASIGSTEVDLDTGEAIWSEEVYRLLEIRSSADLKPGVDTFAEVVHPDDRTMIRDASLRGRRGEEVGPLEFRVVDKDGKIRWFYRTAAFVRDAEGRPKRLIATMYDITARKTAELSLRENEQRYSAIFRHSPIGIGIGDLSDGTYIDVNQTWLNIFGFEREEVIGRTSAELDLWVDRGQREAMFTAVSSGLVYSAETRNRRKDGTIIDIEQTARRIEIGGRLCGIALGYDMTERKRLERERRIALDQLASFFEASPAAIIGVDHATRIVIWNPAAAAIFGFTADEAVGQSMLEIVQIPPEELPIIRQQVERVRRGDVIHSDPGRRKRKDGTWIDVTVSAARMGNVHGESEGSVLVIEDVTDRKKLEHQLVQAQKMEAVGQLTGGVAHDFNNLLMVMLGNLELIEEQIGENDMLRRWIAAATDAGKGGADLTQRLLAFSRRQNLEPETVDLNERIVRFLPLVTRALGEAIELRLKLAKSVWPVTVDPGQFDNTILNLAVNARDAMPKGGWIEIASENVTVDEAYAAQHIDLAAGDYVRVVVTDAGSGMPPEVLARVFEPFFTTKEVGKGTGLGLSMAYGFIKQSGGNATIYSEVGKGTVVRLLLPRSARAIKPIADHQPQTTASIEGELILVVEDDPRVRAVTVAFLKGLGYRTLDTGTAGEALSIIAVQSEIALLLSDVVLAGGETGPSLVREAKRIRPHLRVLFASGYTEDALTRNGNHETTVMLLRKPFTKSALSLKVREALEHPES
jgi:PAS domain S-box-containing protein